MNVFPYETESLFIPRAAREILDGLHKTTSPEQGIPEGLVRPLFVGVVGKTGFRIYLRKSRANNFNPRIDGRLEESNSGCILFLEYRLFPMVRAYIVFWILFVFCAAILSGFRYESLWLPAGGMILIYVILWIVHANFKIHLTRTRQALHTVLSP